MPGSPTAVRHGGERQPVLLTGNPQGGLAAHVQQAQQHLGDLQVRLPQEEAPTYQIYGGPAERSVRAGGVGRDQDQVHQRLRCQPRQVAGQRNLARLLPSCNIQH